MTDKGYTLIEELESVSEYQEQESVYSDDNKNEINFFKKNYISLSNVVFYTVVTVLFLLCSNPFFINYVIPSTILHVQYVYRSSIVGILFSIITVILSLFLLTK